MKSLTQLVFDNLIEVLEADNGGPFEVTPQDFMDAKDPIDTLIRAGYFLEPAPDALDASFWQCAAGEESKAKEFFGRERRAYEALSGVLNRIFERGGE